MAMWKEQARHRGLPISGLVGQRTRTEVEIRLAHDARRYRLFHMEGATPANCVFAHDHAMWERYVEEYPHYEDNPHLCTAVDAQVEMEPILVGLLSADKREQAIRLTEQLLGLLRGE